MPLSFSSPFRDGAPWGGLSARTHLRTGARPAALVFLGPDARAGRRPTRRSPSPRGCPPRSGRLEFKAFDAIGDLALYGELLSLLTGLVLDDTLPGRRTTPDAAAHRHVATVGLADDAVHARDRRAAHRRRARRWPTAPPTWPGWQACGRGGPAASAPRRAMLAAYAAGASLAEVIAASATPAPR